jgi:ATP-dependent Clp protease protease subunit
MYETNTVYDHPGLLLAETGVIMLTSSFNQSNIMPIVARIMEYNLLPQATQPEEIKLIINSPGGEIASAMHLIDTMKTSKIPIRTIGMGMVASCGVLRLMSGTKGRRCASPTTSIMSHQYAGGTGGKDHEMRASRVHMDFLTDTLLNHYKKCCGKSAAYINKHLLGPSDVWMTAEEAIKHGIIDSVTAEY